MARTRVDVQMNPPDQIFAEVMAPERTLYRTVWNRTQTAAAKARRQAPVRTGRLRSSIIARKSLESTREEPVFEVVAGGSGVRYAAPQETGFRHYKSGRQVPGFHYLRDALESIRW